MTTRPTAVTIIEPDAGQHLALAGDNYRLVMTGEQTNGAYAVIDMLVPPGGGPVPHAHASFQEAFFVLDGEVVVRSETQEYTARKGAFVNIPLGGPIHSFKNESDTMAQLLCIVVPAGLDTFFQEVGEPTTSGAFLPLPEMTEETKQRMGQLAKEYNIELFPPDYLNK